MESFQPTTSEIPTAIPGAAQTAPRLRIVHLLLYTACVAVGLASRQELGQIGADWGVEERRPLAESLTITGLQTVWTMFKAVGMATVLLMFARWWKRMTFPFAPGEWLLVAFGIFAWLLLAFTYIMRVWENERFDFTYAVGRVYLLQVTLSIAVAVVLTEGTRRLRGETYWRYCVGGCALFSLAQAVVLLLAVFQLTSSGAAMTFVIMPVGIAAVVGALAAFITFCIAVVVDWRRKTPRGWLHWLAVGLFVGAFVVIVVESIVMMIIF